MTSKHRESPLRISQFLAIGLVLVWPGSAPAQTVVATVTAGVAPEGVAVDTVTNKIYVANYVSGNVTVIDGATNSTTTVPAGIHPVAVAVNEATNKIYVAIRGDCSPLGNCASRGGVLVIDGATNSTTTVTDPNTNGPIALAVNSATNKIYVANLFSGYVTVIDGATNSTTTVSDPNAAGLSSYAVAVNPVTNKAYVVNNNIGTFSNAAGNVTVVDGATNSTTTVTDPNAISPDNVAVNSATNRIYVTNAGNYPGSNHGNITMIDGATNSTTTIAIDPSALAPQAVAVNEITNKIYVACANDSALTGVGGVTIIDGTTNAISNVSDPNAIFPHAVVLDPITNKIYVANQGCFLDDPCINRGSTTVINGATNSVTTIIDPNASNPTGLALDTTTDKIYVAGGKVTVIDGGATPTTHILSLLMPGSGSGTVTSIPAGISCSTSCTASFPAGTTVSLTASSASGSTFSGWSTNCSGVGSCNVTLTTSDEFVTATFNTGPPPDFSITPASANMTVPRGGQKTDVITIAPQNGSFANAVQLLCAVTGSTPIATCALSPSSVTPGANPATSTLTITVPRLAAGLTPAGMGQFSGSLYAAFLPLTAFVLIGFSFAPRKSKNRRRSLWPLCGLFIAFIALQAGCGGGSQLPPPLNYTVTVTATSGTIQHTTQVTVTVP